MATGGSNSTVPTEQRSRSSTAAEDRLNNWDFLDWQPSSIDVRKRPKRGNEERDKRRVVTQTQPDSRLSMSSSHGAAPRGSQMDNLRMPLSLGETDENVERTNSDMEPNNERYITSWCDRPSLDRNKVSSTAVDKTMIPDYNQIVDRLRQIRDCIRQASSMINQLQVTSEPGDETYVNQLEPVLLRLKEQEQRYLDLLLKNSTMCGENVYTQPNTVIATHESESEATELDVDSDSSVDSAGPDNHRSSTLVQDPTRRPCIEDRLGRHSDTDRDDEPELPASRRTKEDERMLVAERPLVAESAPVELHQRRLQLESDLAKKSDELEALKEQHDLLRKMLAQQQELRALQGRQATLVAMQESAENSLAFVRHARNNNNEASPAAANSPRPAQCVETQTEGATADDAAEMPDDLADLRTRLDYFKNMYDMKERVPVNRTADQPASRIAESTSEQRHLQEKLSELEEKKRHMDGLMNELLSLHKQTPVANNVTRVEPGGSTGSGQGHEGVTGNEAEELFEMMDARNKQKKLEEMQLRLQQLRELSAYYQQGQLSDGTQDGGQPLTTDGTQLRQNIRSKNDGMNDMLNNRDMTSDTYDLEDANEDDDEDEPEEEEEDEDESSVKTGSARSGSLTRWNDDPQMQEKVRRLKLAQQKLRRLHELVALAQRVPTTNQSLLTNHLADGGQQQDRHGGQQLSPGASGGAENNQTTAGMQLSSAHVNTDHTRQLSQREFEEKFREQQATLSQLVDERDKLLTIQEQLQQLHDTLPTTSTQLSQTSSAPPVSSTGSRDDRRPPVRSGGSSSGGSAGGSRSQGRASMQETVQVTFQEPLETVVSNEELYDRMRQQRILREELREKKRQLEFIMRKDRPRRQYSRNQDNQSDNVSSNKSEGFGVSASVDATVATWGGSTADNIDSVDIAHIRQADVDEDGYPSDGIVQVEEEEEANDNDDQAAYTRNEQYERGRPSGGNAMNQRPYCGKRSANRRHVPFNGDYSGRGYNWPEAYEGRVSSRGARQSSARKRKTEKIDREVKPSATDIENQRRLNTLTAELQKLSQLCHTIADRQQITATHSPYADRQQISGGHMLAGVPPPMIYTGHQPCGQVVNQPAGQSPYLTGNVAPSTGYVCTPVLPPAVPAEVQQMVVNLTESQRHLAQKHDDMSQRFGALESWLSSSPWHQRPEAPRFSLLHDAVSSQLPFPVVSTAKYTPDTPLDGAASRSDDDDENIRIETIQGDDMQKNVATTVHVPKLNLQSRTAANGCHGNNASKVRPQTSGTEVVIGHKFTSPRRAKAGARLASHQQSPNHSAQPLPYRPGVSAQISGTAFGGSVSSIASGGHQAEQLEQAIASLRSQRRASNSEMESDVGLANDQPMFEALRETIYAEVATLISQNELRPHFLVELFRALQLLTSDYLRQRALYTIEELVMQQLDEPQTGGRQVNGFCENSRNGFSDQTPSESLVTSDDDEVKVYPQMAMAHKRVFNAPHMNARPQVDMSESVASASSISTPSTSSSRSPFARESLGDTVIHFDQALKSMYSCEVAGPAAGGDGVVSSPGVMMSTTPADSSQNDKPWSMGVQSQLQQMLQHVLPLLRGHTRCTSQLLRCLVDSVLTFARCRVPADDSQTQDVLPVQLDAVLSSSLAKYEGRMMTECGEQLLAELSEVIFSELAFFRLMHNLNQPDEHLAKPDAQSSAISSEAGGDNVGTSDSWQSDGHDDESETEEKDGRETEKNIVVSVEGVSDENEEEEEEDLGKARDDAFAAEMVVEEKKTTDVASGSSRVNIQLVPCEMKPYTRIGSDEDEGASESEVASAEDVSETAVSRHREDGPREDGPREGGLCEDIPCKDGPREDGPHEDGPHEDGPCVDDLHVNTSSDSDDEQPVGVVPNGVAQEMGDTISDILGQDDSCPSEEVTVDDLPIKLNMSKEELASRIASEEKQLTSPDALLEVFSPLTSELAGDPEHLPEPPTSCVNGVDGGTIEE